MPDFTLSIIIWSYFIFESEKLLKLSGTCSAVKFKVTVSGNTLKL